jgi:hypothetical protein
MNESTQKIKVNKTVYQLTEIVQHTENEGIGMADFITYRLKNKTISKELVFDKSSKEFKLFGHRGRTMTITFPENVEFIN